MTAGRKAEAESRSGSFRRTDFAFTLMELLVVIAIIGILAALLLPVLSRVKRKAAQTTCINNLKQMGLGMQMYINEYSDTFPGRASENSGFQESDWIWWRTNDPAHPVEKSPIVKALANANPKLFRCPLDTDDSARLAYAAGRVSGPYLYSYSMTSYDPINTPDENGNPNYVNPGMTSVFTGGQNLPFKLSAVHNPSGKIMFGEEVTSSDSQDNPSETSHVINDGRWIPTNDEPLTGRHSRNADVTFADFHVEAEYWEFGSDPANSKPDL